MISLNKPLLSQPVPLLAREPSNDRIDRVHRLLTLADNIDEGKWDVAAGRMIEAMDEGLREARECI